MREPWALYLLVFLLVAAAALLFQRGASGLAGGRRQKRRRVDSLGPAGGRAEEADILRRRTSRLDRSALAVGTRRLLLQSGTNLPASTLALIGLGLAVAFFLLLPATANAVLRLPAAFAGASALMWLWLRIKRARRLALFGEQLPEVLDVIVRSLRAGHPLAVSLGLVAREMPAPAGPEFALLVDEVSYGRSVTEAMENLYQRVGYPELRFFVAATAIAHQTGGNLGEILSRLSRMLRDRFRLARRVRALSAEGRFSGYALSVMPIALFGIINVVSRSYYADFWASPSANVIVTASVAALLVGNLVIYRLVNFKV